jgi:hypothetical protein
MLEIHRLGNPHSRIGASLFQTAKSVLDQSANSLAAALDWKKKGEMPRSMGDITQLGYRVLGKAWSAMVRENPRGASIMPGPGQSVRMQAKARQEFADLLRRAPAVSSAELRSILGPNSGHCRVPADQGVFGDSQAMTTRWLCV